MVTLRLSLDALRAKPVIEINLNDIWVRSKDGLVLGPALNDSTLTKWIDLDRLPK